MCKHACMYSCKPSNKKIDNHDPPPPDSEKSPPKNSATLKMPRKNVNITLSQVFHMCIPFSACKPPRFCPAPLAMQMREKMTKDSIETSTLTNSSTSHFQHHTCQTHLLWFPCPQNSYSPESIWSGIWLPVQLDQSRQVCAMMPGICMSFAISSGCSRIEK